MAAAVRVIQVPYDSGHRAVRMGRGPGHLVARGLLDRLRRGGDEVDLCPLETAAAFPTEIGTVFELHRAVSGKVIEAVSAGAFPLVLSGNCNSAVGTVAGLQAASPQRPLGIVWLDGHGDCSTPETFTGDFLDAMGLSTVTGRCWQALTATVPGFNVVPDGRVVLAGGHAMTEDARHVLAGSAIAHLPAADILAEGVEECLRPALAALADAGVQQLYVHLDVDVLDAAFAPANGFAAAGGLLPEHVAAIVGMITERFAVAAAAVASYDPGFDRANRVLGVALDFAERVTARAGQAGIPRMP